MKKGTWSLGDREQKGKEWNGMEWKSLETLVRDFYWCNNS